MAKFTFRLNSILKIKEKIEEQKKLELGNAMIYLDQQKLMLLQMNDEFDSLLAEFDRLSLKPCYPKEYIQINKSIQYVEESMTQQKEVIQSAHLQVEVKRQALNTAVLERKTYEKLKEIAYEQYLQEENRGEFKLQDELTSYKYRQ